MKVYTKDHTWMELSGNELCVSITEYGGDIAIGITQYGRDMLEGIVYAEMPVLGKDYKRGETICTLESRKTIHEVLSPCDGTVLSIPIALEDEVWEMIDGNPEGVEICTMTPHLLNLDDVMTKEQYEEYLDKAFGWRDGK